MVELKHTIAKAVMLHVHEVASDKVLVLYATIMNANNVETLLIRVYVTSARVKRPLTSTDSVSVMAIQIIQVGTLQLRMNAIHVMKPCMDALAR